MIKWANLKIYNINVVILKLIPYSFINKGYDYKCRHNKSLK